MPAPKGNKRRLTNGAVQGRPGDLVLPRSQEGTGASGKNGAKPTSASEYSNRVVMLVDQISDEEWDLMTSIASDATRAKMRAIRACGGRGRPPVDDRATLLEVAAACRANPLGKVRTIVRRIVKKLPTEYVNASGTDQVCSDGRPNGREGLIRHLERKFNIERADLMRSLDCTAEGEGLGIRMGKLATTRLNRFSAKRSATQQAIPAPDVRLDACLKSGESTTVSPDKVDGFLRGFSKEVAEAKSRLKNPAVVKAIPLGRPRIFEATRKAGEVDLSPGASVGGKRKWPGPTALRSWKLG